MGPNIFQAALSQKSVWMTHLLVDMKQSHPMPNLQVWDSTFDIDFGRFQRAYHILVARHESLRTSFFYRKGILWQEVHEFDAEMFKIQFFDWTNCLRDDQCARFQRLRLKIKDSEFQDLSKIPLCKLVLVKVAQNEFIFLFSCHHIISDAQTLSIVKGELFEFYQKLQESSTFNPPPIAMQLREFLELRRSNMTHEYLERLNNYWKGKFREYLFPTGKSQLLRNLGVESKGIDSHVARGKCWFSFAHVLGDKSRIICLGKKWGATPHAVLLSAFFACIFICYDLEKLLIMAFLPGRSTVESKNIVGNLACQIYVKASLNPSMTLKHVLQRVYADFLQSCRYPLCEVVEPDEFRVSEQCLFHFNFLTIRSNNTIGSIDHGWLSHNPDNGYFPLSLTVEEFYDGYCLRYCYDSALYDVDRIDRFAKIYFQIVTLFIGKLDITLEKLKTMFCHDEL